MVMTPSEARKVERPPIEIGETYEFYCEIQQEYDPVEDRFRNYTGQSVVVLSAAEMEDPDSSQMYRVRAEDGHEFDAWEEELNGWDRDLGQFFWPDGTYGPDHDTTFLHANESQELGS